MHSLSLVMRKHETGPNGEVFYRVTDQGFQKHVHERHEKTEELSQIGGDQGDRRTKCNAGFRIRSWNKGHER